MSGKVKAIPEDYHTITPYLVVGGAEQAIEFYKKAFGAKERCRMPGEGNLISHCELMFGNSIVMLADGCGTMQTKNPLELKGTPVFIHLYVENVDAVFDIATKAGAKVILPLKDQLYGDRSCTLQDPFGHLWSISTRIENVSESEMITRMNEMKPKNNIADLAAVKMTKERQLYVVALKTSGMEKWLSTSRIRIRCCNRSIRCCIHRIRN